MPRAGRARNRNGQLAVSPKPVSPRPVSKRPRGWTARCPRTAAVPHLAEPSRGRYASARARREPTLPHRAQDPACDGVSTPESRAQLDRPASAQGLLDGPRRLVWLLLAALVIYSV